jgi:hypothetical protein
LGQAVRGGRGVPAWAGVMMQRGAVLGDHSWPVGRRGTAASAAPVPDSIEPDFYFHSCAPVQVGRPAVCHACHRYLYGLPPATKARHSSRDGCCTLHHCAPYTAALNHGLHAALHHPHVTSGPTGAGATAAGRSLPQRSSSLTYLPSMWYAWPPSKMRPIPIGHRVTGSKSP